MTRAANIPELLAPAGSHESLRAAVANGADAVYLGVDKLNARRSAENFTLETLAEAVRFAHLAGVKVYLTANVLILQEEMPEALRVVDEAWAAGIDAVIVQDIGLLRAVRETLPHVRVHASTQIGAHNSATIETLTSLGVARVTLARELAIGEIATLVAAGRSAGGTEVESFVHGALCVCYSGQCLLSSLIGGRSANRGLCAQPCRLPYELRGPLGSQIETEGSYLLSPRDLAGIDVLPQLVASGVQALKIEGRMKSPEYVAIVTGTYRAALDRLAAAPDEFEVRDGEHAVLAEAFSRGFTTGYLTGERGSPMMSYRRPNNRGVALGRVVASSPGSATIALDRSLEPEDTIEIWTSAGRVTQRAGALEVRGHEQASAPAGEQVTIGVEAPVTKSDRVFRVASASLIDAARRTWEAPAPLAALTFAVHAVKAEPLRVSVSDARGRTGASEGAALEAARTKALTAEEIMEHVGRLGGTPYEVAAWEIDLSPDVGLGFSALHRARREALEDYERGLLTAWNDRAATTPSTPALPKTASVPTGLPLLAVACDSVEIARAVLEAGADEAHVPTWALTSGESIDGVVPVVSRIIHDAEMDAALEIVSGAPRAVVGNLGVLRALARSGTALEAHWSLNVVNPWTAAALADLGASKLWASPELAAAQLERLVSGSPVPLGTAVWGRQELMVTEHCILMAEGDCGQRCDACQRRRSPHVLRDRKGYEFPVVTDPLGRSHLYNSVPLDMARALPELLAAGVSAVRMDVTVESPEHAAAQVRRWRRLLDAESSGTGKPAEPERPSTTGHFFRGVR